MMRGTMWVLLAAGVAAGATESRAENVLSAPHVEIPAGASAPVPVFVRGRWDDDLQGFAFGLQIPAEWAAVQAADVVETALASLHGGRGPDFFEADVDPAGGAGVTVAAVFTVESQPRESLPASVGARPLARVVLVPGTGIPVGATASLAFTDSLGSPPVETGFSLLPARWVRPRLEDGTVSSLGPLLFDDRDGDRDLDEGEDGKVVMCDGFADLVLLLRAPAAGAVELPYDGSTLPAGYAVEFDPPGPWSVDAGGRREVGVRVAIPACEEIGEVPFRLGFGDGLQSNEFVLAATPIAPVASCWPPYGNGRETPRSIADPCVGFEWETRGRARSWLCLRRDGDLEFDCRAVGLGTSHALEVCDLEPGALYEWRIELRLPESDQVWTSPSGWLRRDLGVRFSDGAYAFHIERDYERWVSLGVVNDLLEPVTVAARVQRQSSDDLVVGFLGAGCEDEPVELPPGGGRDLTLAVHGQDAAAGTYVIVVELRSMGDSEIVSRASVTITISKPAIDVRLENLGQQPGTLANILRVTNGGDTVTDLALDLAGPGVDGVTLAPSVGHGYLRNGGTLDVLAVPRLGPGIVPSAYSGEAVCSAFGEPRARVGLAFEVPAGEVLHHAVVDDPSFCASGADWYCTNRPRISIPLRFPAGLEVLGVHDARLTVTLSARSGTYAHSTYFYLNGTSPGQLIGSIVNQVPRGRYEFSFDPSLLHLDPEVPSTNTVYILSYHNRGHYVVGTGVRICVCLDEMRGYVYAPAGDTAEAERRLLGLSGLSRSAGDLAVEILDPADGAQLRVGTAFPVRARVTSHGEPVAGLHVVAQVGDTNGLMRLVDDASSGGDPAAGIYGATARVAAAEDPISITATAWSCAGSAEATVQCRVEADTCNLLVQAMSGHSFHDRCCEHGEGCADLGTCPETPTRARSFEVLDRRACAEGGDGWVVGGFYPVSAGLFQGGSLHCSVDSNAWCPGGDPDPALQFELVDWIPADWVAAARGWLEGDCRFRGSIAHASTIDCPAGADPSVLARIETGLSAAGLGSERVSAGADMACRYDRAASLLRYDLPSERVFGASAPLAPVSFDWVKPLFWGIDAAIHLETRADLDLGTALHATGGSPPDAFAGGPFVDFTLGGTVDVAGAGGARVPITGELAISQGSGGFLVFEFGASTRDLGTGELVPSPHAAAHAGDHFAAYAGMRQSEPFALVRLHGQACIEGRVHVGDLTTEVSKCYSVDVDRLFGDVTVSVDGAAVPWSPEEGGWTGDQGSSSTPIPDSARMLLGAHGTGAGTYDVVITFPVVYRDVPAPEVLRDEGGPEMLPLLVDRLVIELGGKSAGAGRDDVWAVDMAAIGSEVESLLREGRSLTDARREVIGRLDLDGDGVADVIDPSLETALPALLLRHAAAPTAELRIGREEAIAVEVISPAGPVSGTEVVLYAGGTEQSRSLTGADGIATVAFVPERRGPVELRAEVVGGADRPGGALSWTASVVPALEIVSPRTLRYVCGEVPICIAPAVDPDRESLAVEVDGVPLSGPPLAAGCTSWSTAGLVPGSIHEIVVRATDLDGTETVASALVVLASAEARALELSSPPSAWCRGETAVLDANPGRDDRDLLSYEWTAEPEGIVLLEGSSGATVRATALRSGTVQIRCAAQAIGCPATSEEVEVVIGGSRFQRGDANADGSVQISDAMFVLNFLFLGGPEPPCLEAADANDADADLNITDGIYILGFLFLGDPTVLPPPAGADCGCAAVDPGSDLGCASYAPCP